MTVGEQSKEKGFTLLELLIAIFIFAIIISAVYGAYITMLRAVDITESQADIENKARIAMERITADLEGVFLGKGGYLRGRKQEILEYEADTLDFISTTHLVFSKKDIPAGLAEIKYGVEQDPDSGLLQLYRKDIPFRPNLKEDDSSEDKGYLLCDGLKAVQFAFYDRTGAATEDWGSDADIGQNEEGKIDFPEMIEIKIVFASPKDAQNNIVFKTAIAMPAQNTSETK